MGRVFTWFRERIPFDDEQLRALTNEPVPNHMKHWWFCLGGTLLAAALAYLAGEQDERIKSATFFATLIDFAEPGVRVGAAHEGRVQHAGDLDVVDEASFAAQQRGVFLAFDGGAEPA